MCGWGRRCSGSGTSSPVWSRRNLALVFTFILAVTVAFLAGLTLGDRQHNAPASVSGATDEAEFRKVFSPQVAKDPNFRRRHRENVEALEAYCRQSGEMCVEARAARKNFDAGS